MKVKVRGIPPQPDYNDAEWAAAYIEWNKTQKVPWHKGAESLAQEIGYKKPPEPPRVLLHAYDAEQLKEDTEVEFPWGETGTIEAGCWKLTHLRSGEVRYIHSEDFARDWEEVGKHERTV